MAFVDALFDGGAVLNGLRSKCARDLQDLHVMINCTKAIPLAKEDFVTTAEVVRPDVVIDARMRKRVMPETQRGLAPLSIGLGPNFTTGINADIVIETSWQDLGRVITEGSALALTGEPRPIEGVSRERNVYAPAAGILTTSRKIGDVVTAGDVVAQLGDLPILAPIAGCIRGLTRSGLRVRQNLKILEIDPRGDPAKCFGIWERPAAIAGGVLAAIRSAALR
jgi:xanthine dehydrogenase accessory factor